MEKPETIAEVVKETRSQHNLSLRQLEMRLTESIKAELSYAAISYWESGKSEPQTDFLLQCLMAYKDWRRTFALRCLRAKMPEIFSDPEELYRALTGMTDMARHLGADEWEQLKELARKGKES